jgi:hypothetical protein
MTMRLAIDILIAALLVATVCYCYILNAKLGQLRANQDEMKRLIGEFDQAMAKARVGLSELRGASSEADAHLRATLEAARGMADELNLMTKSADRLASRLVANGPIDPVAERKRMAGEPESGAARHVRPVPMPEAANHHHAPVPSNGSQVTQGSAHGSAPVPARRVVSSTASEAERELLNALRRVK